VAPVFYVSTHSRFHHKIRPGLIGAGLAGIFMYLLPVYGSIFGITFLGEAVYLYHLPGIVMIFAGMVPVSRTI
jgi:drug/metabolite transporter (DMT)-like permease